MDADRLREITAYWSYWEQPVPTTVPREVALPARLRDSLALVVQGLDRVAEGRPVTDGIGRPIGRQIL